MGKLTPQELANQPTKYQKQITKNDIAQSTFQDSMKFNYETAWGESETALKKIQQIMKENNIGAVAARNLLLHEMNLHTQTTGLIANPEDIYTGKTKKLYSEWLRTKPVDLNNSPVQKAYEEYKKQIKTESGIDVLFDTKYGEDGSLKVLRPLTPKKEKQGWFGDAVDFLFGGFYDDKDELYDKKLTKEAVWRADWDKTKKAFNPDDIDSIYEYAQNNRKFKESLEVERARLHNIHIKDINAKWEKDVDEGLDQMTAAALAKGMDDLFIFRPFVKTVLGERYVGLKDVTQANQIEVLSGKDGVYGQIDKSFKNSKGYIDATKDASMWEKGYKFGISQLPMTLAMLAGSAVVGSAVKGLGALAAMDVANLSKVDKTIKPLADFLTKGNNLNPVRLMLNYEQGAVGAKAGMKIGEKVGQWGLKGLAAFEKSVVGLGTQTGLDKWINPEKREKDPNISWWQEGLKDLVDAGIEGVTEELILFNNLKMAGRGKATGLVNLLMAPVKNAVGENIEEAISGIVNDAFELWYKGKWGNQSIVSQIARNDYSQIYTTIGTSISAILMGGAFGIETKRREMQFYKNFGFNAKDIIEKWVNIKDIGNEIVKNLNDSLSPQQRIALSQAMDEGKILFAAYDAGKKANISPEEQQVLDQKYGNDDLTKKLSIGMMLIANETNGLGNIFTEEVIKEVSSQIRQSMIDNNIEISDRIDKFFATNTDLELNDVQKQEIKQTIIENAIFNTKFDYSTQQTFDLLKGIFKDNLDLLSNKVKDFTNLVTSIDSSTALKSVASLEAQIKKLDQDMTALQEANKQLEANPNEANQAIIDENNTKLDVLDAKQLYLTTLKKSIEENTKDNNLNVYKDPLMAFVGFRKEFLESISDKMTPQEVYQKAKDILKISHPYSKNGRNAKAYLQGIVKEIEKKAQNGMIINQSEKEVYKNSIEALATLYSYEDEKYGEKNLEALMKDSKNKDVMNMVNWFSENRDDLSTYVSQTIINHLAIYNQSKGEKLTTVKFNEFKSKFNSLIGAKSREELKKYLEEIMPDYENKAQFNTVLNDMLDIYDKISQKDKAIKAKRETKSSSSGNQNVKGEDKILGIKDTLATINGENYLVIDDKYVKIPVLQFSDIQKQRIEYLREWQNDKGEAYNKFKNALIDRLVNNIPFDITEFDEYVSKTSLEVAIKDMYSILLSWGFILGEQKKRQVKVFKKGTDGKLVKTKEKLENFNSIYTALVNFNGQPSKDVYVQGYNGNDLLRFILNPIIRKYDKDYKMEHMDVYAFFKINEIRRSVLDNIIAFLNSKVNKPKKAPTKPVEPQTTEESTETPPEEKKVAEKLKFDLYQPDGFKKEGDVFEVTFFEGQDVGELTVLEEAKTNETILQNVFQVFPDKIAEYLNNFTSDGPKGIEVVEKGEVKKIDGKIVITKPMKISFVGGFTVNKETPSINFTESQDNIFPEWTNPNSKQPTVSFTSKIKVDPRSGVQTITFEKVVRKKNGDLGEITFPSIKYNTLEDFLEDFELIQNTGIDEIDENDQKAVKNIQVREIRLASNEKAALTISVQLKLVDGTFSPLTVDFVVKPKQGIFDKLEQIKPQDASNSLLEPQGEPNAEKTIESTPKEEIVVPEPIKEEKKKRTKKVSKKQSSLQIAFNNVLTGKDSYDSLVEVVNNLTEIPTDPEDLNIYIEVLIFSNVYRSPLTNNLQDDLISRKAILARVEKLYEDNKLSNEDIQFIYSLDTISGKGQPNVPIKDWLQILEDESYLPSTILDNINFGSEEKLRQSIESFQNGVKQISDPAIKNGLIGEYNEKVKILNTLHKHGLFLDVKFEPIEKVEIPEEESFKLQTPNEILSREFRNRSDIMVFLATRDTRNLNYMTLDQLEETREFIVRFQQLIIKPEENDPEMIVLSNDLRSRYFEILHGFKNNYPDSFVEVDVNYDGVEETLILFIPENPEGVKEELNGKVLVYDVNNTYNEIFASPLSAKSIHEQIKLRYYYKNIEFGTGSYYLTARNSRYKPDDYPLSDESFRKEFNSLVSLFRVNNTLYLENNVEKELIFLTNLKNQIATVMDLNLTKEDIEELIDLIYNTFDSSYLTKEAREYFEFLKTTLNHLDETVKIPAKVKELFDETGVEEVSIKHAGLKEIKAMFSGEYLLDALYNNDTGEISVAHTFGIIENKILHEALHHVFKTKNMFGTLAEVTALTREKIVKVVEGLRQILSDGSVTSSLFIDVLDAVPEEAQEAITSWFYDGTELKEADIRRLIEDLTYAVKSETELFANFYSNTIPVALFMSLIKADTNSEVTDTVFDRYLNKILNITNNEIIKNTLAKLYNDKVNEQFKNFTSKVVSAPPPDESFDFDDDEIRNAFYEGSKISESVKELTKTASKTKGKSSSDFSTEVLEGSKFTGMMTNIHPEIIDLNQSSMFDNVLMDAYDEEELNLDAYTMTKFLDDFMLMLGDNFTASTAYEYFHDVPLDKFMEMIDPPSEELKEKDLARYQAQTRIANYFNYLLMITYDGRSNEDKNVFDNEEDKRRRRIIDLFNKITSPNKHSIFEIILTTDETGEEDYAIRFMGHKSRTMDGKIVTQFRPPMMITEQEFLNNFINLFNSFGVVQVGTRNKPLIDNIKVKFLISALGKSVGESNQNLFAQPLEKLQEENGETKLTPQFRSEALAITKMLWNEDFNTIFMNKFGDKNHFPAFEIRFNKEAREEIKKGDDGKLYPLESQQTSMQYLYNNVILPLYKTYRDMGIIDIVAKLGVTEEEASKSFFTDEELDFRKTIRIDAKTEKQIDVTRSIVTSLVLRTLAEEFKLKNPISNFKFNEDGTADINTMLKGRNMIDLMKRATPVLEHKKAHITESMVLGDKTKDINPLKSTLKVDRTFENNYEIATQENKGTELIWNGKELFFQVAFLSSKQVPPELRKYFFNKYGQFAFDGASFVVRDRFDSDYAKVMGVPNEGSAKNVILPKNAFIKHAVHAIHSSDPIGKWMIDNHISMLIFDESEKNKVLLKEGETLLRNAITGEIPLDPNGNPMGTDLGFRVNEVSEDFLSGNSAMKPVTYFLSFNDIGRIGEKYSNKVFAKSLQQLFNSSGMTIINKALNIGSKEDTMNFLTIVNEYSKTFADDVNKLFSNIDADGNAIDPNDENYNKELAKVFVKHMVSVAKNSTGDLTKAFGKIFNEIVVAYEKKDANNQRVYSDAQIFDHIRSYMPMPLVAEVAKGFMNRKIQAAVKMEDRGKQLVITPDMGNISQKRLDDALESTFSSLEFLSKKNPNTMFLRFRSQMIKEYVEKTKTVPSEVEIFKEVKKRYSKFKSTLDEQSEEDRAIFEKDMEAIRKEAKALLDSRLDENGFLKRDYCFITKDTAIKLGIYVGDRVVSTIIPSAGLMEGKGLIVAGIIESSTMSPGTMIVNREYIQGIGRDYDIDVINLTVRNRQKLTLPKWNQLVDRLTKIEKKYVEETYKLFEKYLTKDLEDQIKKEINEKFQDEEYFDKLSDIDKKMLVAFDNRLFTEFQKKFLGESKTGKPYYSVAENWNFELADKYHKDVGYVIVMRTIHQYLSSIGLKFELKIKIGEGKGSIHTYKVDFTEQDNWFENHISHMILTQHQVDYPKNTSKDEYDFSGEAIVAKMLGIEVPYQDLNETAKKRIRDIYKVFQSIITPLRIPDYKQSTDFKTEEVSTKYENFIDKLALYQNIKDELVSGLEEIDQVSNIELNTENEKLNPYNTFAGELDYSNLVDVKENFMNFDPVILHNYNKAIEYKILMDFISDTSNGAGYYLMNEVSRNLFERNIKGISQYFFTIKSYNGNDLEFNFNEKFYRDLRLRGKADFNLIAPERGKPLSKDRTNTTVRFIDSKVLDNDNNNLTQIRLFDRTIDDVLAPQVTAVKLSEEEVYRKNYEYYTHAMILEGVSEHLGGSTNHTKKGLLRTKFKQWQREELEPYIASNTDGEVDLKNMDTRTKEKWIRAFLLEHYGVSNAIMDIIDFQAKHKNMLIPNVIYQKILDNEEYYINKLEKRKPKNSSGDKQFYDANTAYLYFIKEVTGITDQMTRPPQIHYYLFEEKISQADLVVPSILTGIMRNVVGTFSGDNENFQASAKGFIENKEKFREVVTVIAFSQLIIVGKRDYLVTEIGEEDINLQLQNVFSETLAKLNLDYIIDEQYSKIALHMLSNPATKWRKAVKKITVQANGYVLNISHTGKYKDSTGSNVIKVIKDGKLEEELINEIPVNSIAYGILNDSNTWSNQENRQEIIAAFDLFDEENYDLEDRLKLFSQLMDNLLLKMNLGTVNENGIFEVNDRGRRVVDTAFKWMVGFAENTGTLSNSMYMPGVVIDNRILLTLMAEWSRKTLNEYKHKFQNMSNGLTDQSQQSRVFDKIGYQDIEIDLQQKPKRIEDQERVQHERMKAYRSRYEGSRYSGIKLVGKDLNKSKEDILQLARDVDVLRTSHILGLGDYIQNITSTLENKDDIETLVDKNELENLVKSRIESFDNKGTIQRAVMQQIYTDLQVMKRDYSTIKKYDPEAIKYLMDFSYEDSRLDFDIFSNPLRFNRRIAFRTINFDKFNFETTEELEDLKWAMNHPKLNEQEKTMLSKSEQRVRLEEIKKEAKQAYKEKKAKEQEQVEHEFYFIDPTEAYIRSRGTLPFNRQFTGLRPFSLMDLNFAKMSALSGQLANSSKELQDVVTNISRLKENISYFNDITAYDQQKFEAEVYKQAERLGDDGKFDIKFNRTTGLFIISYGDNIFRQYDQTNFDWLIDFARYYTKQNTITKEQILALYGAINLRKLFDIDLKLYLERTFFYFKTMQKEFGADPLFAPEINRLKQKYDRFVSNFTKFSTTNSEYEEQKITPKIYLGEIVKGQFPLYRFSGRYNYLQNKLKDKKTSPEEVEELEKLFALPYEEMEQKIMLQLQEEIDDRTTGNIFYVPLFNNIADNRLPNHIPSLEMIKEHIIQTMFTMIESDIATCYYYQSKAYGLRNATPANEMRVLDRWFEGISNPLYLKNRVVEVTKLKKDDYVVFYTHKLSNEGEQYSALNSGKVSSIEDSKINLIDKNGDTKSYPLSDIFVIDTETSKIIRDSVYIQKNDRWAKEIENKVANGTATNTEKFIYHSLNGFSELFVSSQMLWWSVIRTRIVQKLGGQIENYSTGDMTMKEFFDELSSGTKAKIARSKTGDKKSNTEENEYAKALLAASTYGGNQALDISMSETSQVGKDILVLSSSYRGSMELLKKMRRETPEYKAYMKLVEETEKRIKLINTRIAQGAYKTKDSERDDQRPSINEARKEIRNLQLHLEVAKAKLDEEFYNLEEVDDEYANIFQEALKEVTDIKQLYGFTNKEVSRMIKSLFWKHFKSLGFNYVREPEIDLRNASFELGFSMAKDNGSSFEEALANGYKYTAITQVIYEKYAKKIGTDDVFNRAKQLLGNYTHQKMMWFKYRLSEYQYQKLAWQLKGMFGYDQYVLDTKGNITLGKSSSGKKGGTYKTKSGEDVQVKLGASSFASMVKMLRVSTFLTYLSNHMQGVNSVTSPFIAPFLMLLQSLLNLFDPDDETTLSDFLWVLNLFLGLRYGVGVGMLSTFLVVPTLYSLSSKGTYFEGIGKALGKTFTTRVVTVPRDFLLGLKRLMSGEYIEASNYFTGAITGFKFKRPEQFPASSPALAILDVGLGSTIPLGNEILQFAWSLEEYDREAYLNKKKNANERRQEYQEKEEDPMLEPIVDYISKWFEE